MGQKVNPLGFRLGVIRTWDSRWYAKGKQYEVNFREDYKLRKFIKDKLKHAGVAKIDERDSAMVASVRDPPGEHHLGARVLGAQAPRAMGADHSAVLSRRLLTSAVRAIIAATIGRRQARSTRLLKIMTFLP